MHGLINRAIQRFVCDTYGRDKWLEATEAAGLDFTEFEAMLHYDDALTETVLQVVARQIGVAREIVLEDIGTYLVSHPNVEALRRLLRFGGVSFVDFLHSLDDLPDRARLAVCDLDLPAMDLNETGANRFSLRCTGDLDGFGFVMVGVLRTLADDYGTLVVLEHRIGAQDQEEIDITVIDTAYAVGRRFELGARAG